MIVAKNSSLHDRATQKLREGKRVRGTKITPDETLSDETVVTPQQSELNTPNRVDMSFTVDTGPVKAMVDEALTEVRQVGQLIKHVGCFLTHPDCRVQHPSMALDLTVTDTEVVDGALMLDCTSANGDGGYWRFPLSEVYPAGPFTDFQRMMVRTLGQAVVEDTIAQLIEAGALKKPDPSELPAFPATGGKVTRGRDAPPPIIAASEHVVAAPKDETVHDLGVHPEYVINPKSTTCANPGLPEDAE